LKRLSLPRMISCRPLSTLCTAFCVVCRKASMTSHRRKPFRWTLTWISWEVVRYPPPLDPAVKLLYSISGLSQGMLRWPGADSAHISHWCSAETHTSCTDTAPKAMVRQTFLFYSALNELAFYAAHPFQSHRMTYPLSLAHPSSHPSRNQ
jgi:hypothetical protein